MGILAPVNITTQRRKYCDPEARSTSAPSEKRKQKIYAGFVVKSSDLALNVE
jgi:hypothetical protein